MSNQYLKEPAFDETELYLLESSSSGGWNRRTFLQVLGSGLLISTLEIPLNAQWGREDSAQSVAARLYLNDAGDFTALSGKVEEGQGPRTELSQAAAEELRIPIERVRLVMADTDQVPDDGITAGSRSTPVNVPHMRRAAATARDLLQQLAARKWGVEAAALTIEGGMVRNPATGQTLGYEDLSKDRRAVLEALENRIRTDVTLTPVSEWKVLGRPAARPNIRELVTGKHRFPSDIARPGMLYGAVLRPPSFGAELESIDLSRVDDLEGVTAVREGSFVALAAPTSFAATRALDQLAETARWREKPVGVSHRNLHQHLIDHAQRSGARSDQRGSLEKGLEESSQTFEATYRLAYIQHAPMEPRAAVAEWDGDRLTVWVGCDGPFRARGHLSEELGIPEEKIRVVVPDMGGGFGGKHTSEPAVEAARLARKAGKPVWVRWTREEEFTWAYCRPAAVIECRAGLDGAGSIVAWDFANINGGGSGIETPYEIPHQKITTLRTDSPLRQGSYRCLGATGSNFARESFMDELAASAGADPLEFRLTHLKDPRMRTVLETAASRFNWSERSKGNTSDRAVGLACGTEKNSYVAACVEVAIDRKARRIKVVEVCESFECGPILNPDNLRAQVEGCISMGLGGALSEELEFENGKLLNPTFARYRVPRFRDMPRLEIHLVDNPRIEPAGGGETPIIAVAPAIGNAVYAATGIRLRAMPMRGEELFSTG